MNCHRTARNHASTSHNARTQGRNYGEELVTRRRFFVSIARRWTPWWLFLCFGSAAAETLAPPRVVQTVPENGARSVDAATAQLRVTFDQPMGPGYSFVGGGPGLPEVLGTPEWISDTTVVLRVRLAPDRGYRVGINSDRHREFRGTNGLSAVPHLVSFRAAPPDDAESLAPDGNRKSLNQLRSAIESEYSHRDLRDVDWDARFAEFEPRLIGAPTSGHFAHLAGQLLEAAHDVHIRLEANGERFASFRPNVRPNADFGLLKREVPDVRSVNHVVATGRFPQGPAYLMISSWERRHGPDIEAAGAWIDGLAADDTLILDVRFNDGGDERLAAEIAGRFVERSVNYARHRYRDASTPSGFSATATRTLHPIRPGFRGRTVVLMGPANVSSAEAFLLMMRQAPRCTLVGESSYGSSGNPKPVTLANGVTAFLPSWETWSPDGEPLEGNGVSPDIAVAFPGEPADEDPLIDAAVEWLVRR